MLTQDGATLTGSFDYQGATYTTSIVLDVVNDFGADDGWLIRPQSPVHRTTIDPALTGPGWRVTPRMFRLTPTG